ncbi:MAG: hypothetical protein Q8M16_03455 [Pirellulaceae bacterium]|nr:hypothetical protein [Pirellulaceae bacterium]
MSGPRLLGHVLLWVGFLAASIAMVMQRELDLLPEAERAAFLTLPAKFSAPRDLPIEVAGKPWPELDTTEFLAVLAKSQESSEGSPDVPTVNKSLLIRHRTERIETLWPTVNWIAYLPALVVGIVGVVLLRSTAKQAVDIEVARTTGLDPLRRSLSLLLDEAQKLKSDLPRMTPESVVAFIDDRCTEHCNNFADQRDQLKSAFGLNGFGEIMSEFASGERFLNRTWSAAADGYMEEAYRSIETSLRFFQAAHDRIKKG